MYIFKLKILKIITLSSSYIYKIKDYLNVFKIKPFSDFFAEKKIKKNYNGSRGRYHHDPPCQPIAMTWWVAMIPFM